MIDIIIYGILAMAIILTVMFAMGGSPVIESILWKWYENTMYTPNSPLGAENAEITLTSATQELRLRFGVACTVANESVTSHKLQYSTDQSSWNNMGAAQHFEYYDGLANDGQLVLSRQLSGTDDNGYNVESDATISWTHTKNAETEHDIAIRPTANAIEGQRYYFRWVQNGVGIAPMAGYAYPSLITYTTPGGTSLNIDSVIGVSSVDNITNPADVNEVI